MWIWDTLEWQTWDSKSSCCTGRKFCANPPRDSSKRFAGCWVGGAHNTAADKYQVATKQLKSIGKRLSILLRTISTPENMVSREEIECVHICADHNLFDKRHMNFPTPDLTLSIRVHHFLSVQLKHTRTNTHPHKHAVTELNAMIMFPLFSLMRSERSLRLNAFLC